MGLGSILGAVASVAGAATGQPWLAAAGTGLSALGAGADGQSSARSNAAYANAFTKEQLQNRHQWEVSDLKKAGLNPILSAGAAPSIGSSAMPTTIPLDQSMGEKISSTAFQAKMLQANLDNIISQADKAKADASLSREALKTQQTQQFVNAQLGKLYDANAVNVGLDSSKKAVESAVYNSALSPVRFTLEGANKIGGQIIDKVGQNIFDAWKFFNSKGN